MATFSGKAYKAYPDRAFVSRRGRNYSVITGLQQKKLQKAFSKAKASFDAMFANNGAEFVTRVQNKAGHYSANIPNTLALTGARTLGKRGPASIHVRGVASDETLLRDLGGGTTVTGTIDPLLQDTPEFRYVRPALTGMMKAAFEGKITQIGVFILQGFITDPGDYNDLLTTILKTYLRDAYQSSATMAFTVDGGGFTLHTHIDGTDPTP